MLRYAGKSWKTLDIPRDGCGDSVSGGVAGGIIDDDLDGVGAFD